MPDSLSALRPSGKPCWIRFPAWVTSAQVPSPPTRGRCGNPRCHCHLPNDPGHGPNDRLTYKRKGKTVTETFPTAVAQRKAQHEIAEFRRFQQLSRALWRSTRRSAICGQFQRPQVTGREKTVEAIQKEVACEIDALLKIVLTSLRKAGCVDLEAVEGATRAAVHRAGAAVLAHLLDEAQPFPPAVPCGCGYNALFHSVRSRQLLTAVGPVRFHRAWLLLSALPPRPGSTRSGTGHRGYRLLSIGAPHDGGGGQARPRSTMAGNNQELLAITTVTRKAVEAAMPKRSAPISLAANRRKSSVPCNSPCRHRGRFPDPRVVLSRWMARSSAGGDC